MSKRKAKSDESFTIARRRAEVPPQPLLQRLYESSEWSDLTLRTSTKNFKVHKCVVLEECPLLAILGISTWKNIGALIDVTEPAEVVDVLLRRMYDMDVPFALKQTESPAAWQLKAKPENFHLALAVREAAHKYGLPNLDIEIDVTVCNCIAYGTPSDVIDFAQTLHREGDLRNWFALTIIKLAKCFKVVLDDQETWLKLCADPWLHKWVSSCVAEMLESMARGEEPDVMEAEKFFAKKTGKPADVFASPKTRPSWCMAGSFGHYFL